jgi:hypothetical protein
MKLKHWRAFRDETGWNAAPALAFLVKVNSENRRERATIVSRERGFCEAPLRACERQRPMHGPRNGGHVRSVRRLICQTRQTLMTLP